MPDENAQTASMVFDGGPRHGQVDTVDVEVAVIGTGAEGGVYQRTDDVRGGLRVYRWEPLSDQAVDALLRGDLRANQPPEG